MRKLCIARMAVLAGLLAAFVLAERSEAITLSDVSLGTHVTGEKWDVQALKGHTVYLEYWDTG